MDSVNTQTFGNAFEGKPTTQTFEAIGHVIFYVCVFVLMALSCGQVDDLKVAVWMHYFLSVFGRKTNF